VASIEQVIQRETNPFDAETFWSGNFWQEKQNPTFTVESIHQEAVEAIDRLIHLIGEDRRTRTVLLEGETGSGKTYLLGRLKRFLNHKAFFVYVEPFTASEYIWRHILRYTVDSLLEVPEGEDDSQLLIWLKGLSHFEHRSILDLIRGDRQLFIRHLRDTYSTGIYNANEFFGVLYDLTNPKLSRLACEWLRGDDLDEESLKILRVQHSIDTEDAAQKIMANFGRISAETKPIVLCFDQLDNIARLSDGAIDLQSLFSVNSAIHNQKFKNFLVLISIITDTWRQNAFRIQATDRDRLDCEIQLKQINLYQAESLWASRLYSLHRKSATQPPTNLYPLDREILEEKFPGGKTRPRNVLILGRQLFQDRKLEFMRQDAAANGTAIASISALPPSTSKPDSDRDDSEVSPLPNIDAIATFKLVWLKKFKQTESRITRIRQFSSPELMAMLAETLEALDIAEVRPRLLDSRTYASYSLSYRDPRGDRRVGVVWSEDLNLTKFCNLMKLCQEAIEQKHCDSLYLIRAEQIGNPNNMGYKIHAQIFADPAHRHLVPDLDSVHYLATYHGLVNDAYSGDLVVGDLTPNIEELKQLIQTSNLLVDCPLLDTLGAVRRPLLTEENKHEWQPIEDFLLNRAIDQQCMARQRLLQEALGQFSRIDEAQINQLIEQLCDRKNPIAILNPQAKLDDQLVYVIRD
jgi:hypothetical protein